MHDKMQCVANALTDLLILMCQYFCLNRHYLLKIIIHDILTAFQRFVLPNLNIRFQFMTSSENSTIELRQQTEVLISISSSSHQTDRQSSNVLPETNGGTST